MGGDLTFLRLSNETSDDIKEDVINKEYETFASECTEFVRLYPDEIVGVFGDNINEENTPGRKDRSTESIRQLGISMRDNMRNQLQRSGFKRVTFYKRNRNNHVVNV